MTKIYTEAKLCDIFELQIYKTFESMSPKQQEKFIEMLDSLAQENEDLEPENEY